MKEDEADDLLKKNEGDKHMNAYDQFMQSVYKPMREDLVQTGFTELTTAEEVQGKMESIEGTALVVVNSVCGCAAGQARPAVREALKEAKSSTGSFIYCVCWTR